MFVSNNRPSFHLWWKENLVKHWKVSKYYETDCRSRHVVNIRTVSVWWCLYVSSNTSFTFEGQFIEVKQHWGWVEKCVAYKKVCILLVPLMISPSSCSKSVINLFFVPSWISSCFCVNGKKISFSRPDFVDSEIAIWGLTSLMDFDKRVQLLFKKRQVSDCQKKISFVQKTHLNSHF